MPHGALDTDEFVHSEASVWIRDSQRKAHRCTATVATFTVDDVESVVAELTGRGVVFERYDEPGITTDARGIAGEPGMRVAWFKDPDGNTFAVAGT